MEDIIKLEGKATTLCEAMVNFCKDMNLSAVCDVTLSMEVSVIIAEENIEKINELCRKYKYAKSSHIEKICDGFAKITVHLEE